MAAYWGAASWPSRCAAARSNRSRRVPTRRCRRSTSCPPPSCSTPAVAPRTAPSRATSSACSGRRIVLEDDGDIVARGGGAPALANVEWRLPIAGAFGLNLFVDGGNVWRETGDVDLSEARWGAGLDVRYASPIGPLRVEIGWKLEREPYEDPYVAFVSLGNAF